MNKLKCFTVVIAFVSIAGCGSKKTVQPASQSQQPAIAQATQASPEDYIPAQNQYGTVTSCPVMGEKVVVDKDTKAVKYKGKEYFLCCPSCIGEFKANPDKFAK